METLIEGRAFNFSQKKLLMRLMTSARAASR